MTNKENKKLNFRRKKKLFENVSCPSNYIKKKLPFFKNNCFLNYFRITEEQERLQEIMLEFCKTLYILSDNKL